MESTKTINKRPGRTLRWLVVAPLALLMLSATSCKDMMDVESDNVVFAKDNDLSSWTDTVYSVMGIVTQLQRIVDANQVVGEVRGNLVQCTDHATADIKALANFTADASNKYNVARRYYAIINGCNFFLTHADTSKVIRNQRIFEREYAVVKTYRAWTYLQLVQIYGKVPFVLQPVLSEAEAEKDYPMYGITDIANYFITDLAPYIDVDYPQYGSVGGTSSRSFYIPTRLVLGDLCLWAGRYTEAAQYYHDFLTRTNDPQPLGSVASSWTSKNFERPSTGYSSLFGSRSSEYITSIPMETTAFNGTITDLPNIYNSTEDNYYYNQVEPSAGLKAISAAQTNCLVYTNTSTQVRDTIYAPSEDATSPLYVGDLRLCSYLTKTKVNLESSSLYSADRQTIAKINKNQVVLYRLGIVYLRYAEALNRAGFPEAAFCLLKYGLYYDNIVNYVSQRERDASGTLFSFSTYDFDKTNTIGFHQRGSGDCYADTLYAMPQPPAAMASQADTLAYQQEKVEDLIVDEMAMEEAFEGFHYYDLMRVALRRSDPAFFASRIAARSTDSASLYQKLLDENNWYLPLK
jgi:hypothetical protein